MAEVSNLDTYFTLVYFHNDRGELFIRKDPETIMIIVVGLMTRCFFIFVRISLFFLEYPPKILGGFTWKLQKSLQLVVIRFRLKYLFST